MYINFFKCYYLSPKRRLFMNEPLSYIRFEVGSPVVSSVLGCLTNIEENKLRDTFQSFSLRGTSTGASSDRHSINRWGSPHVTVEGEQDSPMGRHDRNRECDWDVVSEGCMEVVTIQSSLLVQYPDQAHELNFSFRTLMHWCSDKGLEKVK